MNNINELICSGGLSKHWTYGNKTNYELSRDYLQKINYSIMDFNQCCKKKATRADICYLILTVTWIEESCKQIYSLIDERITKDFRYEKKEELEAISKYVKALRSFVVAHPLTTDRHRKYELDGNYICIDISSSEDMILKAFAKSLQIYDLRIDGLKATVNIDEWDYRLYVYSKKEGAKSFQYFQCYFSDLEKSAEGFIDELYSLSDYLKNKRKKDFGL